MGRPDPLESSERTCVHKTDQDVLHIVLPKVALTLALLAIVACWVLPWIAPSVSVKYGLLLYLVHWAAVGGLIGFAFSKGHLGPVLGTLLGAFIAKVLML